MPSFIYRFSNLTISLFFIFIITLVMTTVPYALHSLLLMQPNANSEGIGRSLFSPAASTMGLLIGFLLNQSQANFREVEKVVNTESSKINQLDRLLLRFGSNEALMVRIQLKSYIESIINDEWPNLSKGMGSSKTHMLWRTISQNLFKLDASTPKKLSNYSDIIKLSEDVAYSRETRIDSSANALPRIFWIVIAICLFANIFIETLFMPLEHFRYGLAIMPIIFGGLISLLVITDQPFKGEYSIAPSSLKKVLLSIESRTS